MSLDVYVLDQYWKAITPIEAQDTLVWLNIVDHPHKKEQSRKQYEREIRRKAYPDETQKEMSLDELEKHLGSGV